MAEHTPGPWSLDKYGSVYGGDGKVLLVDGVALPTGNHPQIEEAKANSRLIAAAPELLAACEAALSAMAVMGAMHGRIPNQVRAAIARAKGGAA